ncbi:MAG: hypothetical protein ABIC04_02935 [Nanoarchaeota archaeon]
MKKSILVYIGMLIICLLSAYAADVCIVAQLDSDKVVGDCVNVASNADGFTVLDKSGVDFTWSEPGEYGRALCKIEGIGDDVSGSGCSWGSDYWGFYLIMDNTWSYLPVGFDTPGDCWNHDLSSFGGHYCAVDGDVIGFRYGPFGTLPDMLNLDSIKIYVDGTKSKADENGGTIKDVLPESKLEIKVKLGNLYPDDVNIDITDITVEGIITDIDDGDDLDEESDSIDLGTEEDDELSLQFNIPLEVEDNKYDLQLTITGEDEKGIQYETKIDYTVDVAKDTHQVKFLQTDLFPESISCSGSAALDISLVNIGKDAEDVSLSVSNYDLGIILQDDFTLDEDPFDEDSKYNHKFSIFVQDAKEGIYPLTIKAAYGSKDETEIIDLIIEGCASEKIVVEPVMEEPGYAVIEEHVMEPSANPVRVSAKETSFWERYGSVTVISAIFFILFTSFIVIIILTMKR